MFTDFCILLMSMYTFTLGCMIQSDSRFLRILLRYIPLVLGGFSIVAILTLMSAKILDGGY